MKHPILFEPIRIAGTFFRNRLFSAPMDLQDLDPDAVEMVLDARLQLQSTTGLVGAEWENAAEPFTATGQTWQLDEPFTGREKMFYRLIWKKGSE